MLSVIRMECTKCHRILPIETFSYKNVQKKIYYLHCDSCREKLKNMQHKKELEREQYELVKKTNVINCECGKTYVAFRDYHIYRHNNSKHHLSNMI